MNWRNLMDSARGLAGQVEPQQPGRPRQEPLKKAASAAYYAMFHALCRSNAETMTGRGTSPLSQRSWTRTYRALQHRQAKNRLLQVQQDLPPHQDSNLPLHSHFYRSDERPPTTTRTSDSPEQM